MIIWIAGQTDSGKTTFAERILEEGRKEELQMPVWLDGDKVREIWPGLGLSPEDRLEQNLRVARLARELSIQEFDVLVSVICPFKQMREEINKIIQPVWVWIDRNTINTEEKPFEPFDDAHLILKGDDLEEKFRIFMDYFNEKI